jgi:hypothetical protein
MELRPGILEECPLSNSTAGKWAKVGRYRHSRRGEVAPPQATSRYLRAYSCAIVSLSHFKFSLYISFTFLNNYSLIEYVINMYVF